MTDKISGYTAYVREQAKEAQQLNHQPVKDFLLAMQLYYKRIRKLPRIIKASDLAQELEAEAAKCADITTYPDDWLLNNTNVADLVQLMEVELKDAGVKCYVLDKEPYITPDVARNRYIFFYTGDKYADYERFIRMRQYNGSLS